jgi:hypothetical protein
MATDGTGEGAKSEGSEAARDAHQDCAAHRRVRQRRDPDPGAIQREEQGEEGALEDGDSELDRGLHPYGVQVESPPNLSRGGTALPLLWPCG